MPVHLPGPDPTQVRQLDPRSASLQPEVEIVLGPRSGHADMTRRRSVRHQCDGRGGGQHTGDTHIWVGLGRSLRVGPGTGRSDVQTFSVTRTHFVEDWFGC